MKGGREERDGISAGWASLSLERGGGEEKSALVANQGKEVLLRLRSVSGSPLPRRSEGGGRGRLHGAALISRLYKEEKEKQVFRTGSRLLLSPTTRRRDPTTFSTTFAGKKKGSGLSPPHSSRAVVPRWEKKRGERRGGGKGAAPSLTGAVSLRERKKKERVGS